MDIIVIVFVTFCFLVGLAGTLLPVVPGTGLIFAGILGYVWYFGVYTIGLGTFIAFCIATLFSFLFDYLGSAYGAKRYGSTGWGVAGSVIGGILGVMIFNVIGLVVGIFLGAALAEAFFAGKSAEHSLRVGAGSVLGFLGGTILNFLLGLTMIIVFLVKVLF
jgi:uncharacterized protein